MFVANVNNTMQIWKCVERRTQKRASWSLCPWMFGVCGSEMWWCMWCSCSLCGTIACCWAFCQWPGKKNVLDKAVPDDKSTLFSVEKVGNCTRGQPKRLFHTSNVTKNTKTRKGSFSKVEELHDNMRGGGPQEPWCLPGGGTPLPQRQCNTIRPGVFWQGSQLEMAKRLNCWLLPRENNLPENSASDSLPETVGTCWGFGFNTEQAAVNCLSRSVINFLMVCLCSTKIECHANDGANDFPCLCFLFSFFFYYSHL